MNRVRLSTKARVALFEAADGKCHICGLRIAAGQEWEVSHPIPLAAGGDDVPENRAPAHRRCHRKLTAEVDQPAIAKGKRIRARHIGAKAPSSHPFNGGRQSKWKRKVDGTVVPRWPSWEQTNSGNEMEDGE